MGGGPGGEHPEEETPSWIWKIKEEPIPEDLGGKDSGKRESKGKDSWEAGPASGRRRVPGMGGEPGKQGRKAEVGLDYRV